MKGHYSYLTIDLMTIVFPLLWSFGKKVSFYRQWKYLWRGMLATGVFFIVWDILFTRWGIWSFNDKYVMDYYIAGLPVEEWLFFVVVPYSCSFIYACLDAFFNFRNKKDYGWYVLVPLGIILIIGGFIFISKAYTAFSFIFSGLGCVIAFLLRKKVPQFRADIFVVMFIISFIPFFIVNGLLTALPVVIYNNHENLGIRILTIPFEDMFYGMLLLLGNAMSLSKAKKYYQ